MRKAFRTKLNVLSLLWVLLLPVFSLYLLTPNPVKADSFPCESHVVYETNTGQVYCIPDPQDADNSKVVVPLTGHLYGYHSEWVGPLDDAAYTEVGMFQGEQPPCYDTGETGNTPRPCDNMALISGYPETHFCGDDITGDNSCSKVFPSTQRLSMTGACISLQIQYGSDHQWLWYCNPDIANVCTDSGFLRAHIDKGLMYLDCEQKLATAQQPSIDAKGNQNLDHPPNIIPPTVMGFPSLGKCYNDTQGLNLDNGDNIVTGLTLGGTSAILHQNGYDDICTANNGYTQTAPKGVQNCAITAYRTAHANECACTTYTNPTSNAILATGNTYTAFGCIPSNFGSVVNIFLSIAIGIAAVVALFMLIIGGYEIMTNPAGPDEIKEGQQYIMNAILGLLLIIFCVIILRILGVDILGIGALSSLIG